MGNQCGCEPLVEEEAPDPILVEMERRAELLLRDGELAEALAVLHQACCDCESAHLYNAKGVVRYGLCDYEGAKADIAQACAIDPQSSLYRYNAGQVKTALKDPTAAKEFRAALSLDPSLTHGVPKSCHRWMIPSARPWHVTYLP